MARATAGKRDSGRALFNSASEPMEGCRQQPQERATGERGETGVPTFTTEPRCPVCDAVLGVWPPYEAEF